MRNKLIELGVIVGTAIGGVSCSTPPILEIFPILEQQCKTENIQVANYPLTLRHGENVVVGSGELFRHGNIVSLTNYGNISVDTGFGDPGTELLPDGRLGLTVVRGTSYDRDHHRKVALKVESDREISRLAFSLNCSDQSIYPQGEPTK